MARLSIGEYSPNRQGETSAITGFCAAGIFPHMEKTFREALENALAVTQQSLLSVANRSGVSYEQLKSLMQGKSRRTNFDDGIKVAAAFGVPVEDFLAGRLTNGNHQIAVAGRVGAGATVDLTDNYAKGDGLYHIACPPQLSPSGIVGVEVTGDSMAPLYHPGDVLLYAREAMGVPSEAINRICVAEDHEGQVWVKQVRTGTAQGLFNLISANPAGNNMLDVQLRWAAPVRLHLPAEFVQRV